MREPYETLLGPYRDHPLLEPYLVGEVPAWGPLLDAAPALSSGERTMVEVALAIWNGDRSARIADLARLDEDHLRRVHQALLHLIGS